MTYRTRCSLLIAAVWFFMAITGCHEEKIPNDAGVHGMDGEMIAQDASADAFVADAQTDACPSGFVCEECGKCLETGDPCLMVSCNFNTSTCLYTPLDNDGDGHSPLICSSIGGDDCNDANDAIYHGAEEICDGVDNDCDGQIDEDMPDCG